MDKSYTAGIFESCGYITFRKDSRTKNSVYPVVIIKTPNVLILEELKKLYGGSVKKSKNTGKIILSHRKALNFLKDIYSYLHFKKDAVSLIIEFYEVRFTKYYEAQRKKNIVKKFIEIEKWNNKDYKNGVSSVKKWLEEV